MTRENFAFSFTQEKIYGEKNKFAPESLLLSALIYAFAVSISDKVQALVLASILPVMILCAKKFFINSLFKLNIINLFMTVTLALTWPEIREGLRMGILIALRLNMIYVIFSVMIFPLGITGIYEALCSLRVPEKLRVLIILTLRGIFILRERLEAALIAVKLRAPDLRGIMKLKTFAYVIAGVLLQSSLHSERIMQAVTCRGGFEGFLQSERESFKAVDVILIASVFLYAVVIIFAAAM